MWQIAEKSPKICPEIVQVLLNASADCVKEDGETVLMCAAQHGSVGVIQGLICAKANVNAADKTGCTALFWCIQYGKLEAFHILVSAGASLDATDKDALEIPPTALWRHVKLLPV